MEDQNKVLDQKLEMKMNSSISLNTLLKPAEMIGYSDYSYWKSVSKFLKENLQ